MTDRGGLMRRIGGALAVGMLGLSMVLYSLEEVALLGRAEALGETTETPARVYVVMFLGLALVNLSVFYVVTRWSRYLHENPHERQLPVWFLAALGIAAGAGLVIGAASHYAWLGQQDPAPTEVDQGFIAFQMLMATLTLIAAVLGGVRWTVARTRRTGQPPRADG